MNVKKPTPRRVAIDTEINTRELILHRVRPKFILLSSSCHLSKFKKTQGKQGRSNLSNKNLFFMLRYIYDQSQPDMFHVIMHAYNLKILKGSFKLKLKRKRMDEWRIGLLKLKANNLLEFRDSKNIILEQKVTFPLEKRWKL